MFDMASEYSYIDHVGEEIDFDIIFGHDKEGPKRKLKAASEYLRDWVNMAEDEALDDATDTTAINDTVPMVTHVPFMVYKVSDPNMRVID